MKKYLRDVTSLSDAEFFNKAEELALKRYANSEEKFDSKGMYVSTDNKGNLHYTFDDLWSALIESYGTFDTTDETLVLVDGGAKAVYDGYQKGYRTFVLITECLSYYAHLCGHLANAATNWADSNIYIAWYDKDAKTFTIEYMVKNNIRVVTDRTFEELKMKEKVTVLENPAYSIGGKITVAVKETWSQAKYAILMPLAQYEIAMSDNTMLYQYVKTLKTVGWTADSANVTQNNSIITLTTDADKSKTSFVENFMIESFDQRYRAYYDYNITNYKGYCINQTNANRVDRNDVSIETDFIEGSRVISYNGGGFTCDGFGYKLNVLKDTTTKFASGLGIMHMGTEQAKDNISCWAYNYHGDKTKAMSTKVMWGIKQTTVSSRYYMYIPQIDWNKIHINQKELWDAGKYDEAVLTEMGLKWEGDKIVKAE